MKQFFLLLTLILISSMGYSQKATAQQRFDQLMQEGNSFFEAGKMAESITAFTEALKINPDATDALLGRGMAYFSGKDFDHAIPDFTRLIELDAASSAEAYFMRGLIKTQLKDPEADGCADLKKAKDLGYSYDWEMLRKMFPNL